MQYDAMKCYAMLCNTIKAELILIQSNIVRLEQSYTHGATVATRDDRVKEEFLNSLSLSVLVGLFIRSFVPFQIQKPFAYSVTAPSTHHTSNTELKSIREERN